MTEHEGDGAKSPEQEIVDEHCVIVMRHGEKPSESGKPHGINAEGEQDPHALSVRGWTRAGALASMFGLLPQAHYPGVQTPKRVYATKPSHQAKSTREYDTALPTADKLGIRLHSGFTHGEEKQLAREIINSAENTLVVWHHGAIAELMSHFEINNSSEIPSAWPEDRFDVMWVLSKDSMSVGYTWHQVNQSLLSGDE